MSTQITPQALKQNLYRLDEISDKMIDELKSKNKMLESGINEGNFLTESSTKNDKSNS